MDGISCLVLCLMLCFFVTGANDKMRYYSWPRQRVLVLNVDSYGLGNRLRALADWYLVARQTQRKLLVSWATTSDCNAKFLDLFDLSGSLNNNSIEFLPFTLPFHNRDRGSAFMAEVATRNNFSLVVLHAGESIVVDVEHAAALYDAKIDIVFTSHIGSIVLPHLPCVYYMKQKTQFLRSLRPIPEIKKVVDDLWSQHFLVETPTQSRPSPFPQQNKVTPRPPYPVVGIHARMHDAMFDWAVVPPMDLHPELSADLNDDTENLSAGHFGAGATVQHFGQIMQDIQQHFAVANSSYHRVRFLVTSNMLSVKRTLVQAFPQTAVAYTLEYNRSSVKGMQLALVELLLLSRCDLIVNTYGSTFAVEAAMFADMFHDSAAHDSPQAPLLGIVGGELILYDNTHLPYCGNMLFLAAYSELGRKSQYVEGTTDHRTVNSTAMILEACDLMDSWGIRQPVYCIQDA